MLKIFVILSSTLLCLTACSSPPQAQDDLGAIDVVQTKKPQVVANTKIATKSEQEIKDAYYNYIKNSPTTDRSRRVAINRLAELEMNRLNHQTQKTNNQQNQIDGSGQQDDALTKTLALLQTSLEEYPDAKDNDKTLYQLARIQDQLGDIDASLFSLGQLSQKYPSSPYYAEAQFRIAENAFVMGDYLTAEMAYSEITYTPTGETYHERALFKRGWARYKQSLFTEAADDFIAAIDKHNFSEGAELAKNEKDQYDEYLRALGLTISSLPSKQDIQNYFSDKSDAPYLYDAYAITSDVYLEQEKFSDAAAIMEQFIVSQPKSVEVPFAHLKKIEAWATGKFYARVEDSVEVAYSKYNGKSSYWDNAKNATKQDGFVSQLRPYVLAAAFYAQDEYQKSRSSKSAAQANLWYKRYLENYSAYAQQDKVYSLYAELLTAENKNQEAMHYFELAAYDGTIVLNKEAAYATIVLSNKLYEQDKTNPTWLNKLIQYTLMSAQLYPKESRYHVAALHAAELALKSQRFDDAIKLANALPDIATDKTLFDANVIKGLAYLEKKSFVDAETIFADLLKQNPNSAEQKTLANNLALSIYQQAEQNISNNQIEAGIQNFARISKRAPTSDIAPKALYEAVALSMKHEQWTSAIGHIQQFQKLYPASPLYKDATRQLSIAYLNAGDGAKAAQTFEQIAAQEENQDIKMASLWKAAELYESKRDVNAAIRAYTSYVDNYSRPYPQYMEAMYKLTQLHKELKAPNNVKLWQEKIFMADNQAVKALKTERTNYIVANAQLDTAKTIYTEFLQKKLTEPLAESLKAKKLLMQNAIAAFGQASNIDNMAIATEATYSIGNMYQQFSKSLLQSERPKSLTGEELEQYNILIEDQAFPFEEKAIEFYEINMAHIKNGASNQWISQSYQELGKLYPVRYNKKGKADVYHNDKL